MENHRAANYIQSFLGKQLRISTTDTRVFSGEMKCTDKERNIILARTHEYRYPSAAAVNAAASSLLSPKDQGSLKVDMTSRFLGLVVVPGQYITKIEVEEYSARGELS
ncbi:MAG: hypothetical protein M1827_002055 [Pycnora praestabilis]|nr:MAG: hypothetical protein M1827_002055 [Pycnora praestabilis]